MIALITGITGQDGSYLAELLLEKGYEVHGIVRRSSLINTHRIDHIYDRIHLHYGDLTDSGNLISLVQKIKPTEVYNLGAMSHVKVSFEMPDYVGEVDALGTLRLLDAIRLLDHPCKFYQASTSELYGLVQEVPQRETTPFYPRSPYGVAKLYSYWITGTIAKRMVSMLVTVFFSITSPHGEVKPSLPVRSREDYQRSRAGLQDVLELGNLDAQRDWGHAKDYVRGMWMIAQHETPDDFVLATGEMRSVRQFVEEAAQYFGFNIEWRGEGLEVGFCKSMNRDIIRVNPKYYRPTEVEQLLGDPSKARNVLGWEPEISFKELVEDMCIYGQ